jgi:hypothetical protein
MPRENLGTLGTLGILGILGVRVSARGKPYGKGLALLL